MSNYNASLTVQEMLDGSPTYQELLTQPWWAWIPVVIISFACIIAVFGIPALFLWGSPRKKPVK